MSKRVCLYNDIREEDKKQRREERREERKKCSIPPTEKEDYNYKKIIGNK